MPIAPNLMNGIPEVYVDRRENWIKEEVEGTAKELDTEITRFE